jgi:Uma2 family endonuclease
MASLPRQRFSPEEYLALERKAEYKNEFLDGEIIAMTGASEAHNLIVVNIVTALAGQLKTRPCKVYSSDMRVDLRERGFYAYPDVIVVCGESKLRDGEMDNLLNPTVIIEVLSKSTEDYDRGRKFVKYRAIESLVEYVLIAQDRVHVEQYVRQANGEWVLSETDELTQTMSLGSVECSIRLVDVYDKVTFSE